MTNQQNSSGSPVPPTNYEETLQKVLRLKEFAIKNGYEVDQKTVEQLNALAVEDTSQVTSTKVKWDKLDSVIKDITSATFPTTIDSLSPDIESKEYKIFKIIVFALGIAALASATYAFASTANDVKYYNSILALSLGLLGAITYSLFNVLRIVPPQAFDPRDAYSNYARLLLGVLLGWVFYFVFAIDAFKDIPNYFNNGANHKEVTYQVAIKLMLPFVAGYSTKFVVGILNRAIAALEIALGIDDKRDIIAKRITSRRG